MFEPAYTWAHHFSNVRRSFKLDLSHATINCKIHTKRHQWQVYYTRSIFSWLESVLSWIANKQVNGISENYQKISVKSPLWRIWSNTYIIYMFDDCLLRFHGIHLNANLDWNWIKNPVIDVTFCTFWNFESLFPLIWLAYGSDKKILKNNIKI
jgi:hypothetical protein